ncbi:MAG: sulfatase-like hydrolase/transferase [Planctomycetales bacterium]|nr:sulfatase-like hydrolase/transferase [Planctomycetales bacterium]
MNRPFVFLLCSIYAISGAASASDRLNVVFITVDDLNCDSVGAFGCPIEGITPRIDKLATEGMRFEHAHVTIAICQPTRAVWMTGRYPHRSGALGFDPINEGVPTLLEAVRSADYYTGILGKTNHIVPTRAAAWNESTTMQDLGFGRNPDDYKRRTSEIITNAKSANKPFFIMANAHDPHRPFDGSMASEKKRATFAFPRPEPISPDQIPVPRFLPDIADVRIEMAQYFQSARRADQVVGAVLDAIDLTGSTEDTMVVFMSDHGMSLPFAKTNCWWHSTRTPWIVRWPGIVAAGSHDAEHVISGIDVAPTVLDAIGLPNLKGADGRSIVPVLKGEHQAGRDHVITHMNRTSGKREYPMRSVVGKRFGYIYSAWPDGETVFRNESQSGLTMKAMKEAAVRNSSVRRRVDDYLYRTSEELYDYSVDSDALSNLVDNTEFKSELQAMRRRMLEHMRSTNDPQLATFQHYLADWSVELVDASSTSSFRGLHVLSDKVVWATGQHGTVRHTNDGGSTWNDTRIPGPADLDYRSVAGLSESSAIAISAGSPARIMKTEDGGKSWTGKYESSDPRVFFDAVAFWNDTHGITFSDPVDGKLLVLTTIDGGDSWSAVESENIPAALEGEAGFAASNSCLTVFGDDHVWIGLGGATSQENARIMFSYDGGKHWDASTTTIPSGKSGGVFSVAFRSERYGVAVGGDYTKPDAGGRDVVSVTRDGGQTWHAIVGPGPSGFRSAVAIATLAGRQVFVATGPNGCDISFDGGQSWRPFSDDKESSAFHAIGFATGSSTGFGGGAKGKIGILRWNGRQ